MVIDNLSELEKAFSLVSSVFDVNQEFPNQVFKKQFKNFYFDEFDWALTSDFLPTLQQLAKKSGDTFVVIGWLGLDSTGFLDEYSSPYWFKVPINITKEDYKSLMRYAIDSHPSDEFSIVASTVVWVPLSGKWALWGNRSYEICALSFAGEQNVDLSLSPTGRWRTIEEALETSLNAAFRGKIPPKIKDTFLLNYSNKSHNLQSE